MTQNSDLQLSIIVVGETGVGKSSLCKGFTEEKNKSVTGPTVIASSWQKDIVVNEVKVKLLICDTGGQEAYRNNITSYFDKKDGVLAVYDVTNKDSFLKLSYWLDLVRKYNRNFVAVIVGNKTDYLDEKSIKRCDVEKLGKENGVAFLQTSAKDRNSIKKVFEYLVLKLLIKKKILSVDKLNLNSYTLLLYESPVISDNSLRGQNWEKNVSETPEKYVCEEDPIQAQNIPVVPDSPISTGHPPCTNLPSNKETEQTLSSQVAEGTNENKAACESGAATFSDPSVSSPALNDLPPIIPLTQNEIDELYVQRQRRMSSNSISSLANWDSSIVSEYEEAIKQYEEARAEAAKNNSESSCTLL